MKRLTMRALLALLILPLLLTSTACSSRTDEADTGGVTLVVSDFDEVPLRVSVNGANSLVTIGEIELQSLVLEPGVVPNTGTQTIELRSYEVRFEREDTGTRVPNSLVQSIFGTVEPAQTTLFENVPILAAEQLLNTPLSDLLFVNGGFDKETGSQVIRLRLRMVFFGRTVSGREVATEPQFLSIEFTP